MKYVVFKLTQGKGRSAIIREIPVIFPDALTHALVAESLVNGNGELKGSVPIAAGFLSSLAIRGECAGKSESLGLKSREAEDEQLICTVDYTHGVVS